MHELGLIKDLIEEVEKKAGKDNINRVSAIIVEVSRFAGLNKKHFRQHFDSYAKGSFWQRVELKIKEVPYGAPLSLVDVSLRKQK